MTRAVAYLADVAPAIQGQHGQSAAMWAARVVCWGFDLDEETAFAVLIEHYNPRCLPPWQPDEFHEWRRKCSEARSGHGFGRPRGWLLNAALDRASRRTIPAPGPPPRATGATPRLAFGELGATTRATVDAVTGAVLNAVAGQGEGSSVAPAVVIDGQVERPGAPNPPTVPPDDGDSLAIVDDNGDEGIDETDPGRLARLYAARFQHPDGPTLRHWEGGFAVWRDGAYDRLADDWLRGELTEFVEWEFRRTHAAAIQAARANYVRGGKAPKLPTKPRVTRNLIGDVIHALESLCRVPRVVPCWLDDGQPAPAECMATRTGVLHVPSWVESGGDLATAVIPATPRFVSTNRIECDFRPDAPEPVAWLEFLGTIWPDDQASIDCLQEWFGYLLTPDTSLQKMLLIIGPPRCGKGTICRVIRALVGERNYSSLTLGQLDDQFSLSGLLNKTVAVIPDARLSLRDDAVRITEQLLCISGEDERTIDRKFKAPITRKLDVRFTVCSNEIPRLGDASGAIMSRFRILKLTRSFLGTEDTGLIGRLLPELPGILLWALEGWERLQRTRRFTAPESANEITEEAAQLSSPVRLFIEERCELGDQYSESKDELYKVWAEWCKKTGRPNTGTRETFLRDLSAAAPSVRRRRAGNDGSRRQVYSGIRVLSSIEAGDISL